MRSAVAKPDPAREYLGRLADQERALDRRRLETRSNIGAIGGNGGLAGGKRDRLTDDWQPGTLAPNQIHRADGILIRDRARDLVLNNPLAKGGVDTYIANVVESGITPKPRFAEAPLRQSWSASWDTWGGLTAHSTREADLTGIQTIYELMALWLEEVIVGGGCLIRFVELPRSSSRRLPLAIELIPEERFADDRDWPFAGPRPLNGNPVRRGIEVDALTGRPVAYWIRPYLPNDPNWLMSYQPVRIPAEQCEYAYFRKRIGQNRGYTLLHAAILWLWKLGYYTDNELMNSAVRSCFSAMITRDQSEDDEAISDGDPDGPATDAYGNILEKLQPALIFRGRPGDKIEGVGPNTPPGDAKTWVNLIERSVGIGMGLSYEELCRDYSQTSFSSCRAGANADRKRFRPMQQFVVNHFCNPVYRRFVQAAVRAGIDGFPRPSDFLANIDDWLEVAWRAPGWASVKPIEDAQAAVVEIDNGLRTRESYIGERGGDWEETFQQLAREEKLADDLDLEFPGVGPPKPPPGQTVAGTQETPLDGAKER
ncbi:MAG TPA: phage portal protein [Pirellulales bacterium]|nr:phage portal protein [Pirellulales bacterium]